MVLLCAEGQKAGERREAEPDHWDRVLESNGVGPEDTVLKWPEEDDGTEKDPGVLQGEGAPGLQNWLGYEWVSFAW